MPRHKQPERTMREYFDLNRLIHEPARLMILMILYHVAEVDFIYLLGETKLTRGNLSSHLTKLADAGLISIEKGFIGKKPQTICAITEEGLEALTEYCDQMRWIIRKME